MDRIVSDRAIKIIALIIGIIIVIDIVNVFVVGGPSVVSLIFKPGNAASASEISSAAVLKQSGGNATVGQDTGSSSGSIQAIYVPTKATPVPTVQYVREVTPIQTTDTGSTLRYVQPVTQVTQAEDNYALIYSNDLIYIPSGSPSAVAFDVVNPPLIIKFTVTPVMTTHTSVSINRSAKKSGMSSTDALYNLTYASENSRFTVTVHDKATGQVVDQDGYGGIYDQVPDNTFTLRKAGSYLIQFDGEQANAHVEMLLKKEGNIA